MFRRGVFLALAAAMVAGCHDSAVAPRPVTFDASHALARVNPLAAVFDQPIFVSFNAALTFFEGNFRSTFAASASPVSPSPLGVDLRTTRALVSLAGVRAAAIPDGAKGKTFVYDVGSHAYIIDVTATGAPANGVRYVLYQWGAGTGAPALPLTRIGYVEITQVGTAATTGSDIAEVVLFRDHPFLVPADFMVRHSTNNGVNVFGIEGSAVDGITSDDVITVEGTESGSDGHHVLVYNTTISSTSLGVTTVEQLTSDQASGSQSGKLEVRYDGHTFSDESVASGAEVKVDGSLYARVLFPAAPETQTRYVRPDGTALSAQEVVDLNALLERVIVALFIWIGLAFP